MPKKSPPATTENCTAAVGNMDGAVAGMSRDLLKIIRDGIPSLKGAKGEGIALEIAARIYKQIKPDMLEVADAETGTIFQVQIPKAKEYAMRNGKLIHLPTEKLLKDEIQNRQADKKHKLCNGGCALNQATDLTEKRD